MPRVEAVPLGFNIEKIRSCGGGMACQVTIAFSKIIVVRLLPNSPRISEGSSLPILSCVPL